MDHSPPITFPVLVTIRNTYSACMYSVVRHSRQTNGIAIQTGLHKLLILLTWIRTWCRH